jgi:hypothetical protein
MQVALVVGAIVLSLGAAVATSTFFLAILLRIMSKLR